MTLPAGTTIGRYEVIEGLGQGGMAIVYKARQPGLDRIVALKVIRSGYSDDPEFLERFKREARAVARLDHPNVVQVYDFDEVDGRPILAMQFLDGGTLKDRVARLAPGERLPEDEIVRIIDQVAAGLAYAHSQGVVHRDVKPANIMLTRDGRAVVTDFGIARMLGGAQLTATGVGIGTPDYMSPEQGQGGAVDARSDVYSLGVVAFELLTGRLPFTGDTPFAIVLKHVRDPLPPPTRVNPALPASLDPVMAKALAKEPSERYATVTELAGALRATVGLGGAGITLPTVLTPKRTVAPSPRATRDPRVAERDRKLSGAIAVAALLGVIAFDLAPRLSSLDVSSLERALPSALPTIAASPTPRPVAFRPEQLIMPPERLPVTGYEVSVDQAYPDTGREPQWRRIFAPKTAREYGNIEFRIGVLDPGQLVRPSCDGWSWTPNQPTETTVVGTAATLGDRSVLCRFRFSDGTRWFVSWVADRNAESITYLFAKLSATDAAATDLVMSLSQKQLAIIAEVSPR